ncbi:MAG: PqiC family protein [Desulfuromonadales bacterium]
MIRNQPGIYSRWSVLLLICMVFSGCIGKKSSEVTYFSLLSMEQMGTTIVAPIESDFRIGIGPITIPDVLKRTQLVSRDAQNIYRFDEFSRWAGILEKDIAYVLGDNLGDLLGADKIAFFPWMHHFTPTYRVIIDIIQFDGELTGEAILSARWTIADADGKVNLAGGKSVYRQPVEGGDYMGLVKAESQLLAELSRELAQAIVALSGHK